MNHLASDTKEYYSLYQLLLNLTRSNRFTSNKISPQIKEALLNETFINAQGVIQKMFIFPTPSGSTTRPFLSIHREAIPEFLKRWGATFQVPQHVINKIKNTQQLKNISDEMISIFDFCKKVKAPKSLAFWIEENAFSLLENKTSKEKFFTLAKDEFMFQRTLFLKENLNNFILQNEDLLKFHGLSQEVIEEAKKGEILNYLKNNIDEKYSKETEINLPKLRLDELACALKKTTSFIPHLRKFILQNCLNDTFDLPLTKDKTINVPIFSYYTAFKKNKPSCYIYAQGVPYFVQKYEQELIRLGVKQSAMRSILEKNNLKSLLEAKVISFYDAYLLSMANVDFDTFKTVLKTSPFSKIKTTDSTRNETEKEGIFYVETTLKDPYFVNTKSLLQILDHHQAELHITNNHVKRAEILINSTKKAAIPATYFLKNIGLKRRHTPLFNAHILYPHMDILLSLEDENGNKKQIVPFGFFKNAAGNDYLGVYLDATKAIVTHFAKELIEIGMPKEYLEQMEKNQNPHSNKVRISSQNKPKILPCNQQRTKES